RSPERNPPRGLARIPKPMLKQRRLSHRLDELRDHNADHESHYARAPALVMPISRDDISNHTEDRRGRSPVRWPVQTRAEQPMVMWSRQMPVGVQGHGENNSRDERRTTSHSSAKFGQGRRVARSAIGAG